MSYHVVFVIPQVCKSYKNAIAYFRVSTDEQAQEGKSIETQQKLCRKWAMENGYQIVAEFKDEGKSATSLNRQGLKDLLARCQDEPVDAVLVQDSDRMNRNVENHLAVKAILKKRNIKIIAISQPMLDDSVEGILIDTIIASVNQFQSQITGRKTSKVLEQKALLGWFPGGVPPLGYRNIDNPRPTSTLDKRIIDLDPDTAPYVKKSFEMYVTGTYNVGMIAAFLNSKNVQSPTGSKIHASYVARMFRNRFYIGSFLWNKVWYDIAKHPKLISQALFMKAQQVLDAHNQNATRKRKHSMLLRGFLFCNECESQMWGEKHVKPNGMTYMQYFCPKCRKGTYIDRDKLEERVVNLFKRIQISKEYVAHVLETARKILEEDRDSQHIEKVRLYHEKTKVEKAMKEAEDARFIHHTLTEEAFNRIYARYAGQLKNNEEQIANLAKDHSHQVAVLEKVLRLAENIGSAYEEAPYLLKRNYLGIFFKRFDVENGRIVRYALTDELKPLIKNGTVRVESTGLPREDSNLEP